MKHSQFLRHAIAKLPGDLTELRDGLRRMLTVLEIHVDDEDLPDWPMETVEDVAQALLKYADLVDGTPFDAHGMDVVEMLHLDYEQ